ncbi:hypothetical protein EMIT0194P_10112 [Pseudomonas serbica]
MALCRSQIPCGSEPARDGVLPNTESFPRDIPHFLELYEI